MTTLNATGARARVYALIDEAAITHAPILITGKRGNAVLLSEERETDVAMVYSTDPSVDEYINGARKILGAAFGGEPLEIINGMLDIVEVVASKIIGKG